MLEFLQPKLPPKDFLSFLAGQFLQPIGLGLAGTFPINFHCPGILLWQRQFLEIPGFQKISWKSVRKTWKGGNHFLAGLAPLKNILTSLMSFSQTMIAAGETGGILDTILRRLFRISGKSGQNLTRPTVKKGGPWVVSPPSFPLFLWALCGAVIRYQRGFG